MRRPVLLLLVAAAVLAGCGGGEEGGAEVEIEELIEASVRSADPADCRRYSTMNMLEQSTKAQGEAAVRACEETKLGLEPEDLPAAVEVTRIEVDGGEATAQVASVDGPYEEQEMVVALVEEDESWKEDEVLEFAEFDREAFILEFGRGVIEDADGSTEADIASCLVGRMDQLTDSELEALILDFSIQPFFDLARPCQPRSAAV